MSDFDGLAALVTGAASGIGAATGALLASRGATVAGLDLDADKVVAPLVGTRCDVANSDSVRDAVAEVVTRFGRLDVVVNCAGIGAQGTVADNPDDEWFQVLDVNVVGIARVTREALPHLRRSPSAAVVNICSIVATAGLP